MDVLERAQEMEAREKYIIHMKWRTRFDTPLPVKEAAIRAITAGDTHYTSSPGKKSCGSDRSSL